VLDIANSPGDARVRIIARGRSCVGRAARAQRPCNLDRPFAVTVAVDAPP
jgi:hypothetical protein